MTPKKHRGQQQQGDVTVEYVARIPDGGRLVTPGARGYVIAEGESTGHAHVLDAAGVLELREVDGVLLRAPRVPGRAHARGAPRPGAPARHRPVRPRPGAHGRGLRWRSR